MYADRIRFKQMLYNLLSNAVKFTPEGGRVWMECAVEEPGIRLVVADTGVGIPPEEHEAIFDQFHQVGVTTRGVREGAGLGLAITRRLVELHRGRIWVESQPGQRQPFHLYAPQRRSIGDGGGAGCGRRRIGMKKIVVVDDNAASRELIREVLDSPDHRIMEAADGREALDLILANDPDLVLLDIQLPGLDGYSVVRRLRQNPALCAGSR